MEWPPAAYSPRTHMFYSHARYSPSYSGRSPTGDRLPAGPTLLGVHHGVYGAINTVTGQVAWTIPIITTTPGSGMTVAGDLVFFGDSSGLFYAASAKTGEILWVYDASIEANTGGGDASPAIYEVGGVEYVVYPFGGNPATISTLGDAVIAFARPSSVAAAEKSAAGKARVK